MRVLLYCIIICFLHGIMTTDINHIKNTFAIYFGRGITSKKKWHFNFLLRTHFHIFLPYPSVGKHSSQSLLSSISINYFFVHSETYWLEIIEISRNHDHWCSTNIAIDVAARQECDGSKRFFYTKRQVLGTSLVPLYQYICCHYRKETLAAVSTIFAGRALGKGRECRCLSMHLFGNLRAICNQNSIQGTTCSNQNVVKCKSFDWQ